MPNLSTLMVEEEMPRERWQNQHIVLSREWDYRDDNLHAFRSSRIDLKVIKRALFRPSSHQSRKQNGHISITNKEQHRDTMIE